VAKFIVMDEIHVTVQAPAGLRDDEYDVIRRTLMSRRFHGRLSRRVRELFAEVPALARLRIALSR
jgi:hypothetical protein